MRGQNASRGGEGNFYLRSADTQKVKGFVLCEDETCLVRHACCPVKNLVKTTIDCVYFVQRCNVT